MDWAKAMLNVPMLVGVAMDAVEQIKGAKGPDKEAAVIATVKKAPVLIDAFAGRDVVNDASFDALLAAYIQARVALANFVTKPAPVPEGVILPVPVAVSQADGHAGA